MKEIQVGCYVKVATRTSRHQLAGEWLKVKSARKGSNTITCLFNGAEWRVPRHMVTDVMDSNPESDAKETIKEMSPAEIANALENIMGVLMLNTLQLEMLKSRMGAEASEVLKFSAN